MLVSIISFLGSNCEEDTAYAFDKIGKELNIDISTKFVFHSENKLPKDTKIVILPGGFSYGDYLRCGALASMCNIMQDVKEFANRGGIVIGICNGFQILLEAKLLDGALKRNSKLSFTSKMAYIKAFSTNNVFLDGVEKDSVFSLPIANHDGNFYIDEQGLDELKKNDCIVFKYCDKDANELNINGSVDNIAGICNKNKNVFGLMPHPERAVDDILGSSDGSIMIKNLIKNLL